MKIRLDKGFKSEKDRKVSVKTEGWEAFSHLEELLLIQLLCKNEWRNYKATIKEEDYEKAVQRALNRLNGEKSKTGDFFFVKAVRDAILGQSLVKIAENHELNREKAKQLETWRHHLRERNEQGVIKTSENFKEDEG